MSSQQQDTETSLPSQLKRCLTLDLEVSPDTQTVQAIAAHRPDTGEDLSIGRSDCLQRQASRRIDFICQGAAFVLGHNITRHDLPHLKATHPNCAVLDLPVVDTLHLNPLAFPRHPYHHLVKHYKEADLVREIQNNPLLDAKLALQVFTNQLARFRQTEPALLTAWHYVTSSEDDDGYDLVFAALRDAPRPTRDQAAAAVRNYLDGKACPNAVEEMLAGRITGGSWEIAYALAWISAAGGNSGVPPWVLYTYPATMEIIDKLRDQACADRICVWCSLRNSPTAQLKRWFGYEAFRPEPANESGRSLQEQITAQAMNRRHTLGILPTGTGKSVCYQVPGLSKYEATGKLTVVISPLVALMADQVRSLQERGITNSDAINGMLTMPERSAALDRVRQGETAILLISPEQLRNRTVADAIAQRAVASWVVDESHCLAQWGHDFRPDYRYIARFMQDYQVTAADPTILCLTATAKPEVKKEIVEYFQRNLEVVMDTVDGGAKRPNLEFIVLPVTEANRMETIRQLVRDQVEQTPDSGIIIYCQTRRETEKVAEDLRTNGIEAEHFHSQVETEAKREIQDSFVSGRNNVIAATSAFGMGIDRQSVSAVIHSAMPGSLENYVQEAGRAGRDGQAARCVLLYNSKDIERQFQLNARGRLDRKEISAVLKALRRLKRKAGAERDVETTTGELLREDPDQEFQRDSLSSDVRGGNDDTRVRTAVAWLEEAQLVSRTHNASQIYASTLAVRSLEDARKTLDQTPTLDETERRQADMAIKRMIQAVPEAVISSDEMCGVAGVSPEGLKRLFAKLKDLQIVSNDITMTAYVSKGRTAPSLQLFHQADRLEADLVRHLQEQAPDQEVGQTETLHLRAASQAMRDLQHPRALPELIARMLRSMTNDGASGEADEQDFSRGSIRVRARGQERMTITLNRPWRSVERAAELRRIAALAILRLMLSKTANESNRADILIEVTQSEINTALQAEMQLSRIRDRDLLRRTALLWLHEQEIVRLSSGFTVLRNAMTVSVPPEENRRQFTQGDYEPLQMHYDTQTRQVHIIAEYGEQGLLEQGRAIALAADYFTMEEDEFVAKWLGHRTDGLKHQTSRQSYEDIVGSLGNRRQRAIVTEDAETVNTLVLAGPGSGKTKTLVHRIAYLVRVKRVRPDSIIALAYNRHAAVQIRQRLHELIGDDASPVLAMTLHTLAMRLTGRSFADRSARAVQEDFDGILAQAAELLEGGEAGTEEDGTDELRDRLMQGFRWVLVDEYQDIGENQYRLLSALTGRRRQDDSRINILAVGDDDQNIYSFQGTNNRYIRRFQEDYQARPGYLTENYRSTGSIIRAANCVIEGAADRLKAGEAITVDRSRQRLTEGGPWRHIDPVARGRVQIINCPQGAGPQAMAALAELQRLSQLDENWSWSRCAVIGRNWDDLHPVRSLCQLHGIQTQLNREDLNTIWPLRETRLLLRWAQEVGHGRLRASAALHWIQEQPANPWNDTLAETLRVWLDETENTPQDFRSCQEWLAEWCHDNRQRQHGLLLTSAHSAKGLEFDHVAILDGQWERRDRREDADAGRRLYYVAMTRARHTLTLLDAGMDNPFTSTLELRGAATARDMPDLGPEPEQLQHRYHRLDLKSVYLGFAGHHPPDAAIHQTIAGTETGDPLSVDDRISPWTLLDEGNRPVGRLAKGWKPPAGHRPVRAEVLAIARWCADKSEPEYRDRHKCEEWEVVVPEIVTAPAEDNEEKN